MTTLETTNKRYRITIGDYDGNANAVLTDDLARGEEYALRMLGREWGETREITIARFYEWNGSEYVFHSEMEY
jgi:hypothetical protein